jgi:hypothetical protein
MTCDEGRQLATLGQSAQTCPPELDCDVPDPASILRWPSRSLTGYRHCVIIRVVSFE